VIASISEASQQTARFFAPYVRDGSLRLLTERGEGSAAESRTRMARLAATSSVPTG